MSERGVEPLQACAHKALNLARLPVPPLGPMKNKCPSTAPSKPAAQGGHDYIRSDKAMDASGIRA